MPRRMFCCRNAIPASSSAVSSSSTSSMSVIRVCSSNSKSRYQPPPPPSAAVSFAGIRNKNNNSMRSSSSIAASSLCHPFHHCAMFFLLLLLLMPLTHQATNIGHHPLSRRYQQQQQLQQAATEVPFLHMNANNNFGDGSSMQLLWSSTNPIFHSSTTNINIRTMTAQQQQQQQQQQRWMSIVPNNNLTTETIIPSIPATGGASGSVHPAPALLLLNDGDALEFVCDPHIPLVISAVSEMALIECQLDSASMPFLVCDVSDGEQRSVDNATATSNNSSNWARRKTLVFRRQTKPDAQTKEERRDDADTVFYDQQPGTVNYFISTSNGTVSGMRNTRGGLCAQVNMRIRLEFSGQTAAATAAFGGGDASDGAAVQAAQDAMNGLEYSIEEMAPPPPATPISLTASSTMPTAPATAGKNANELRRAERKNANKNNGDNMVIINRLNQSSSSAMDSKDWLAQALRIKPEYLEFVRNHAIRGGTGEIRFPPTEEEERDERLKWPRFVSRSSDQQPHPRRYRPANQQNVPSPFQSPTWAADGQQEDEQPMQNDQQQREEWQGQEEWEQQKQQNGNHRQQNTIDDDDERERASAAAWQWQQEKRGGARVGNGHSSNGNNNDAVVDGIWATDGSREVFLRKSSSDSAAHASEAIMFRPSEDQVEEQQQHHQPWHTNSSGGGGTPAGCFLAIIVGIIGVLMPSLCCVANGIVVTKFSQSELFEAVN